MFEELETLRIIKEKGSLSAAAATLHLTQPAVTKRIQKFSQLLKQPLLERKGRGSRLTPYAEEILLKTKPHLDNLHATLRSQIEQQSSTLHITVSESILFSWGYRILPKICNKLKNTEITIAGGGGPEALAATQAGEFTLALVKGDCSRTPDLYCEQIGREQSVLIPSKLKPFKFIQGKEIEYLSIFPARGGQDVIQQQLKRIEKSKKLTFKQGNMFRSSITVAKMAIAGFGHGIVPKPVAKEIGLTKKQYRQLPAPGVSIPVNLIGRTTAFQRSEVQLFKQLIQKALVLHYSNASF